MEEEMNRKLIAELLVVMDFNLQKSLDNDEELLEQTRKLLATTEDNKENYFTIKGYKGSINELVDQIEKKREVLQKLRNGSGDLGLYDYAVALDNTLFYKNEDFEDLEIVLKWKNDRSFIRGKKIYDLGIY